MTEEEARDAYRAALRYEQIANQDVNEKARDLEDAKEAAAYAARCSEQARAVYYQAHMAAAQETVEEPPC